MHVRAYTSDDAAAVAALAAADEELLHGRPSHIQAEDVAAWTHDAKASWLFEEDGELLAAGWWSACDDLATVTGIVAAKGRGIGAEIVRRGEERARGERCTRIQGLALGPDEAGHRLFAARGYREVRRFYGMAIELRAEPPQPGLGVDLALDEFRPGDARAFHAALDESFRDHWEWHPTPFDEWWRLREGQHRDEAGPLWFVVRAGDELAAVVRNEANRDGGGYVGALGVRRAWRGEGLANALLYRTFREFYERGVTRVTLGVDAESPTGATHLYERVGMHVESSMVIFEKAA